MDAQLLSVQTGVLRASSRSRSSRATREQRLGIPSISVIV